MASSMPKGYYKDFRVDFRWHTCPSLLIDMDSHLRSDGDGVILRSPGIPSSLGVFSLCLISGDFQVLDLYILYCVELRRPAMPVGRER